MCVSVRVCVRVKERKKEMFVECVDERLYFENAFLAKRGSACVCMHEREREINEQMSKQQFPDKQEQLPTSTTTTTTSLDALHDELS